MVMLIKEISNFPFNQFIFICSRLEISYILYESFDQLMNYFISRPLATIQSVNPILPQDTCLVTDIHHNEEVSVTGT